MSTPKGSEERNEQGVKEIKVETVDFRSPAGHENEPPKREKVEVIHRTDEDEDPGILADAAATARNAIHSSKHGDASSKSGNSGK